MTASKTTRHIMFGLMGFLSISSYGEIVVAQVPAGTPPTRTEGERIDTDRSQHRSASPQVATENCGASGDIACGIPEIVVTAQRRSQKQQDVPIAITAISADAMDKFVIRETTDLPSASPGMHIGKQGSSAVMFLRGVGTNNGAIGSEPSVATYIDGVYSPMASVNIFGFNNIERIEVLRGPQGTLFGRNTIGGVINVTTKDPQAEPRLTLTTGYGNYDTLSATGYGTTGLGDNVAADLAVYYKDVGNGYVENSYLDNKYRPDYIRDIRTKWLFTPSDGTTIRVSLTNAYSEGSQGIHRQPVKGTLGYRGQPYSGDFYDLPSDFDSWYENESTAATVRLDQKVGSMTFVSLSGWRDDEQKFANSADSGPFPFQNFTPTLTSRTLSQEFQLLSNDDSRALSWLVGLYYSYNKAANAPFPIFFEGNALFPIEVRAEQRVKSYAAFGEAHLNIAPATGVTLGFRYSQDNLDLSGNTLFTSAHTSLRGPYSRDKKFEEPTWRVGIDHKFGTDLLGYATYSHGYKMGFYNLLVTSGVPQPPVDSEQLDAFEIGLKSDWLEHRLRVNASSFYYKYKDMQVTTILQAAQRLDNAAKATLYGGELELQFAATSRWTVEAGLSLLRTNYDDFPDGPLPILNPGGGNTTISADLSGNSLPRSPEYTYNVGSSYTLPTSIGEWAWSLNFFRTASFQWEPAERHKQEAYQLLNTDLRWRSRDERYAVSLWSKNLLDEKYAIYGVSTVTGDLYSPAEPRTYGVSLTLSF